MIDSFNHFDQTIFLALNDLNCQFFDQFFFYVTKTVVWIPLFMFLLFLVIRTFKWKTITVIFGMVLMIIASDQLANFSKYSVKRLRPSNEPALESRVHSVNNYKGGQFGFYSGHASNTMALAIFLTLLLRRRYHWLPPVLVAWAVLMSYSRIYLGVHYPGDILAGMVVGGLLGWGIGVLTIYALRKQDTC